MVALATLPWGWIAKPEAREVIDATSPGVPLVFYVLEKTSDLTPGGQPVFTTPTRLLSYVIGVLDGAKATHP